MADKGGRLDTTESMTIFLEVSVGRALEFYTYFSSCCIRLNLKNYFQP